jgi:hypothetical protein
MTTDFISLQTIIKRLPARIIHDLGMHHLTAEEKRAFAENLWQLIDERLNTIIWQGAANNEVMDILQTEYEINPDLNLSEVLTIIIEAQPDLPEIIEQELENIHHELIQ